MGIKFKKNVNNTNKGKIIVKLSNLLKIDINDMSNELSDVDFTKLPDNIACFFDWIPSSIQETRDYLRQNPDNIKKTLYEIFPDKTSREINTIALDYEDYITSAINQSSLVDLNDIDDDIQAEILFNKYPVYNVIQNDIIVIAGQSNVGKSYHCGLMFGLMTKLDKLYICPDQGIKQCAVMLKQYKVKKCQLDDQPNLNFAMSRYRDKNGKYPDVVCYDMLSSLPTIGTSQFEQQANRAQELRKIKNNYPDTTFFFVSEIRKSNDKDVDKAISIDDLMGSSMLAYKSDLVIGIYNKKYTVDKEFGGSREENGVFMNVLKARIGNERDVEYCLGHNKDGRYAINNKPFVLDKTPISEWY